MKKGIAWILLLILCLSWTVSLAETSKELTFQNIPWFSSPEEASEILVKSGFVSSGFGKKNISTESPYDGKPFSSRIGSDIEDPECPYRSTRANKNVPPLTQKLVEILIGKMSLPKTIAKVKIESVGLYFTSDSKNPQLVECFLMHSLSGREAILPALIEAYGEPTASKQATATSCEYIWLGANNTIIIYHERSRIISFATLDGLALADTYDVKLPDEPEDTSF